MSHILKGIFEGINKRNELYANWELAGGPDGKKKFAVIDGSGRYIGDLYNTWEEAEDALEKLKPKFPLATVKSIPVYKEDISEQEPSEQNDVAAYKARLDSIISNKREKLIKARSMYGDKLPSMVQSQIEREYGKEYDQLLKDMPEAHSEYVKRQDKEMWSNVKGWDVDPISRRSPVDETKPGLWANIHAKRERIKRGSGEKMRKPGSKGAPSSQDFKDAAKTSTKESSIMKGLQNETKK